MSTTTPPTADPIDSLNDFTDRLSPIVVKELRQGLRQASFVILFLFLQSILALAVIASLLAVSPTQISARLELGEMISAFFFGLFALAAVAIQPLRALGTLSSEIRDSTIDLLLLTRLSAWRIVFGKWLSLMVQSALMLVAIMPYLMMRYFLGGMNLVAELIWIVLILLFGAMMCAGGVALSSVRSVILRTIFAIIGLVLLLTTVQGAGLVLSLSGRVPFSGFSSLSSIDWVLFFTAVVLLISFMTYAFLEFAATRIAPPSENRSKRKRTISIASLLVICTLFAIADDSQPFICYLAMCLIAAMSMADALSENPRYISHKKREFILLRPGWPCGALFSIVMVGLTFAIINTLDHMFWNTGSVDNDDRLRSAQMVGTVLLIVTQPALVIAIFRARDNEPANTFLGFLFGGVTLGMVVLMIVVAINKDAVVAGVFFPLFPVLGFATLGDPSMFKVVAIFGTSILYLFFAAILGLNKWKRPE